MNKPQSINGEHYLGYARDLVASLEREDTDQAKELIDTLTRLNESDMFREIGKITRELHNALASFEIDSNISKLAEKEIPDAKERLNYVIEMTENAANVTLNVVESLIPECDKAEGELRELTEQWRSFLKKDMKAEEFRKMVRKIDDYFGSANQNLHVLRTGLNEVLMAQSYQDLTGQIIKRVINLVQDVENNLVEVIKITGGRKAYKQIQAEIDLPLEGPQVPNLKNSEAVSSQDEVDDLLSSLGF